HKCMRLAANGSSGVGFGQFDLFRVFICDTALQIAVVASGEEVLSGFGICLSKTLNKEVKLKNLQCFPSEATQRDQDWLLLAWALLPEFLHRHLGLIGTFGSPRNQESPG